LCGDGLIDLEMTENAFDTAALAAMVFVVSDRLLAGRFWRNDGPHTALLQIGADGISIADVISHDSPGLRLGQINQRAL
jgi:hypothetical protein